jgi:predicted nucleic acid-binding protein
MMRCVVDASIVIKWFVPEIHSASALRFLEDGVERLAPDLLIPEAGNILWKKVRSKELSPDEGRAIASALTTLPVQIEPTQPLVELAYEIATRAGRTVYDGMYLALAMLNDCRMVTADLKLCRALQGSPFAAIPLWVEDIS